MGCFSKLSVAWPPLQDVRDRSTISSSGGVADYQQYMQTVAMCSCT